MNYEGLTEEDFAQNRVKTYVPDMRELMRGFFPSPDPLYGYLVQIIGGEKVRYFTPEALELREFNSREESPFLKEGIKYIAEIIISPPSESGAIKAVSMDNLASSLEDIDKDVPDDENILILARNRSLKPELQYPYFIVGAKFVETSEHHMYEVEGEVDSSLVEQYTNPSSEGFLEIYIKRHILADMREAEHERGQYENDD